MKKTGNIRICNGNVFINPLVGFVKLDVQIEDGIITHLSDASMGTSDVDIDATNQFVVPGFVDIHCHLREPGQTHKEDIVSGTRSAAAGGYTTIVAMANTTPVIDSPQKWEDIFDIIQQKSSIEVIQAGSITSGLGGNELSSLFLQNHSIPSFDRKNNAPFVFSDDGVGLNYPPLFRKAIQQAKKEDYVCILHEEDATISSNGIIHSGNAFPELAYPGIPSSSESTCVARDLLMCHEEDYSPHFTHLSSKQSIDVLMGLADASYRFTADTTPHHLYFSEKNIDPTDTNYKMNPPIRSEVDQKALKEGIRSGIIRCIGTDHAPHSTSEKNADFCNAPFGIIGFETAFAASYTALVSSGWISFPQLIQLFTNGPNSILKLQNHSAIQPGTLGNLTIVDEQEYIVPSEFFSKSSNSPFVGEKLKGRIRSTIFQGKVVYSDQNKW